MNSATLHPLSDISVLSDSNDSLKFRLFLKTSEMKQVQETLQNVASLSKSDRTAWAEEHETDITQLLDEYMEDASAALDGLALDQEAVKLSMDFMLTLREAMSTLQSILYVEQIPEA